MVQAAVSAGICEVGLPFVWSRAGWGLGSGIQRALVDRTFGEHPVARKRFHDRRNHFKGGIFGAFDPEVFGRMPFQVPDQIVYLNRPAVPLEGSIAFNQKRLGGSQVRFGFGSCIRWN